IISRLHMYRSITMLKERLHVLVIDDDLGVINLLKRSLPSFCIDVEAFSDPREALAKYRIGRYDSCLVDIRMPRMSGFEVARWIWKQEPDAQICFMSEFEINESEAAVMFPSLKSSCFVKKPISPIELASHIESHFVEA